jgi:hypothetical protein
MDETTFQKELHELKKSVTEIANSPSSSSNAARLSNYMSANAVHNDMFVAQLRDVRTRLDIMQASLLQHGREQAAETPNQPQSVTDRGGSNAFEDLSLNVHALHDTIVRCHRDTNDRISRLEQAVSRLDDPVIFTPTSSETTTEDLTASSQEVCDADDTATGMPEPQSATFAYDIHATPHEHDRPATLSQVLEETWTEDDNAPQPFLAICPSKLDSRSEPQPLSDFLNDSTTLGRYDQLHEKITTYQREPTPVLPEPMQGGSPMSSREEIFLPHNEMGWLQDTFQQKDAEFDARLSAKDAVISHLKTCRAAAEEASQITRTDLEDRLAKSESELARWRDEAKAAQRGFEAMARCNRELQGARDHAIGRLRQDLQQCEESRHHFMTKYVDENYRFKWLEQRKLQSEQKLHQRLDECERALDSSERHREADVHAAIHSRDDDLEQLYAFCQEKADVVSHQEQVIAQGTSIIHERDAEIDRLNVALAESQRGREYVREHAGKFKRVIKKREDEIDELKRKIRDERDRRHRLEDSMQRDADAKKTKPKDVRFDVEERRPSGQSQTLAQATETAGRRQTIHEQPPWTPQPINTSRFEEDRASLWQDGARSAPEHKFGSASPIARRKKPDARHAISNDRGSRNKENVHVRPSDSNDLRTPMMPENQRNSSVAIPFDQVAFRIAAEPYEERRREGSQHEWYLPEPQSVRQEARVDVSDSWVTGGRPSHSSMKAQGAANSEPAENRRHALPLDATWLPPLPARTSASASAVEKVSSVPNLRAGSSHQRRSHDVGAISKPASMLELRPQYVSPSVETEAESAEEDQGGSSLLDC